MNKKIPWELIIQHLKQKLNSEQESVFKSWIQDEANRELYVEIASLWSVIKKEAMDYTPDAAYYWKQLEAKIERKGKKPRKKTVSLSIFKVAIVAASIIVAVAITSTYFSNMKKAEADVTTQIFKAFSGKSQLILPDGSTVWLNQGSTLTYESNFSEKREVKLEGEALFDVKADAMNQFAVKVNDLQVNVFGTRFNIQAYSQNTQIEVALLEGKVSLSTNNKNQDMEPGEIAYFNRIDKTLHKEKRDVAFESFWAKESHTFSAVPLGMICKYLERWYNVEIILDASIANSHVYTFTIKDEPLETILQIMSRINPIQYTFEDTNLITIKEVER